MNDEAKLRTGARLNSIWDGTPIDRIRAGDGSSVIAGKRVAFHLMAQPEAASRFLSDATLRDQIPHAPHICVVNESQFIRAESTDLLAQKAPAFARCRFLPRNHRHRPTLLLQTTLSQAGL